MKQYNWLWASDLHLEFVEQGYRRTFMEKVKRQAPDAFLITGDIAVSRLIHEVLQDFSECLGCPLYFVLGNHDYYGGSIREVRTRVTGLCHRNPALIYLTAVPYIKLAKKTAILGHDGWADGRLGDFEGTDVDLNDYYHIKELLFPPGAERLAAMQALSAQAAKHIETSLGSLPEDVSLAIILTHVPPFEEACTHRGEISDHRWLPYYASKIMGEVIYHHALDNPDRNLLVLCGHTHGRGEAQLLPNLKVLTAGARYGCPAIERRISPMKRTQRTN